MNKLLGWVTKKKILFTAFGLCFLYIVSYFNKFLDLPLFYKNFCCVDDKTLNIFLISIPILILAIFSFFIKKQISKRWLKFTFLFLLFYVIIYFLSPKSKSDYLWFQREAVSLFSAIIYFIASSLILIIYYFKKEK